MSESVVRAANWRLVEVGRVVLVDNKLATIVEIIDQKRALIDGPTTGVQRQSISLARVILTPIVLKGLPRGARTATVSKKWSASDVNEQWNKSAWAQKIAQRQRRSQLTDFERFQVMTLKKQRRFAVKKAVAKA